MDTKVDEFVDVDLSVSDGVFCNNCGKVPSELKQFGEVGGRMEWWIYCGCNYKTFVQYV